MSVTVILAAESTAEYCTDCTDIQVRAAHIFSHFSRDSTIRKTRKWLLQHKQGKNLTINKTMLQPSTDDEVRQ